MYICRAKNQAFFYKTQMLYNFYPKFQCQYNENSFLVFGKFHGDRPAWHYVRDKENWRLEVLERLPQKTEKCDRSDIIYRLSGREGAKTRFTYQKIRRLAVPWMGGPIIKAIRPDLIPD